MTLIVDAGVLYAQADAHDPYNHAVVEILSSTEEDLVTSQFVAAEADYLIRTRLGADVELAFLQDLNDTYVMDALSAREITVARELVAKYRDLALGIADASLVVLADRLNTNRIITLDERLFRTIQPLQGGAFRVYPADWP